MISVELEQIINQLPAIWLLFLVALPRVTAAFMILPLFTRAFIPRQIRIGLVLVFTLVACPAIDASFSSLDWSVGSWIFFITKEIFIGCLIGYAVGIFLWSFASAGELIDNQAGLTTAHIFNPFSGNTGGPFSSFMTQFGVMLFIGLGGLNVFMKILYESFLLWPPSLFWPDFQLPLVEFTISSSNSFLELATRLATPIIGVLLVVELGMGLINRAAPQFNSFYLAMPIKTVVAILMMILMISHIIDVVRIYVLEMPSILPKLNQLWFPL